MPYKETLNFDKTKIENHKLHVLKKTIDINDVNVESVLLSDMHSLRTKSGKCFFGYKDHDKETITILIELPKFKRHLKSFENTKYITFTLEDKHKDILDKFYENIE